MDNQTEATWHIRLGTRVWGPLTESQLRTMYRRGELTKVHQLSESKNQWFPAAEIIASWDLPEVVEEVDGGSEEGTQNQWYYLTANRTQVGPISLDELRTRANLGEVGSETLIFGSGMSEWSPAHRLALLGLPEVNRSNRFPIWGIVLLGLLICLFTAVVGYFVVRALMPVAVETSISSGTIYCMRRPATSVRCLPA